MESSGPTGAGQAPRPPIGEILEQLVGQPDATAVQGVADHVAEQRERYSKRATWHRRWFRSTGILVIAASASIPLLAGIDFDDKDLVVGIVGAGVAILTALRNFYQWDQLWSLLRQSDFELKLLLDQWQLDIAAIDRGDPDRMLEVRDLTRDLRDSAEDVRRAESNRYFGSLRFPSSSGEQN
jgi:hypothetical protein